MLTTKRFSDILRSKAVRTEAVTQGCSVKFRNIYLETRVPKVSFLIKLQAFQKTNISYPLKRTRLSEVQKISKKRQFETAVVFH